MHPWQVTENTNCNFLIYDDWHSMKKAPALKDKCVNIVSVQYATKAIVAGADYVFLLRDKLEDLQKRYRLFLEDVLDYAAYTEFAKKAYSTPNCALVVDMKAKRLYKYTANLTI